MPKVKAKYQCPKPKSIFCFQPSASSLLILAHKCRLCSCPRRKSTEANTSNYSSTYLLNKLPLFGLLLFALLWYFTYPVAFQISDEKAYIEQAIALSEGRLYNEFGLAQQLADYNPKNYPVGTAVLAAPLVWVGGKWAVFLLSPICYVLAIFLSVKTLEKLRLPIRGAFAIALFLPAMVMSRHVMSEMPSLLCVAAFVYTLALAAKKRKGIAFLLGWLALAGLLFRESNILLTLPLLLQWWSKEDDWTYGFWAAAGAFLAIGMRLATTYFFYGDIWYIKDPGVIFTPLAIPSNLPYYAIGLLLLLPAGAWWLYRYQGWYGQSIRLALLAYILLHLCYDYRGEGAESGALGSFLLVMRFLIPTLALFALLFATAWNEYLRSYTWNKSLIFIGVVILTMVYLFDFAKGKQQRQYARALSEQNVDICASKKYYEHCSTLYE